MGVVFVVTWGADYEGESLAGAFTTITKARDFIRRMRDTDGQYIGDSQHIYRTRLDIQRSRVHAEVPVKAPKRKPRTSPERSEGAT